MLTIQSLKEKVPLSKVEVVILMAIIIIAAAPRFWNLDDVGLSGDEAVYAGQARVIGGDDTMSRFFLLISRGSTNFMLHQAILALVYEIVGFSDFATRALPASMSLATVLLVFFLARELFDRNTAIISASLMAISGYAIAVARVGLLDSTMLFFFVFAALAYAKWLNTEQSGWLYLFALTAGLAALTKVPSLLIFPVVALATVFSGQTRVLWNNRRTVMIAAAIFGLSLTPALFQILSDPDTFISFFSEGSSRVIKVPPTYYLDKLTEYGGVFFTATAIFGIGVALFYRERRDFYCIAWFAITLLFFQLHPIKGWNYVLPLIPPVAILTGRAFARTIIPIYFWCCRKLKKEEQEKNNSSRIESTASTKIALGLGAIIFLGIASYFQIATLFNNLVYERPFVGLREAAFWLEDNVGRDQGVMTISHGSAQYVLSLYGNLDAYPFGKFRLHTVLPGGGTVKGAPMPDPLIQNGTVSYFVYYVSTSYRGDDPIHDPGTPTESKFIRLIHKYQSNVRHTIYDEFVGLDGETIRQPRAWIFEVGKRLPEPHLDSEIENEKLKLKGTGFLIDSYVNIYYGRDLIAKVPTDNDGAFFTSIEQPLCGQQLVVFDDKGNRVSVPLTFCGRNAGT